MISSMTMAHFQVKVNNPIVESRSPPSSPNVRPIEASPSLPPRARTLSNSSYNSPSSSPRPRRHSRRRSSSSQIVVPRDIKSLEKTLQYQISQVGEKHPSVGALYNCIGNWHFRMQNLNGAVHAYQQAVQCDPGEHLAAAYANLGTVYWSRGNIEAAVQVLHQALRSYELDLVTEGKSPEDSLPIANCYHQLGLCHALQGNAPKALHSLERALRIRQSHGQDVAVGRTLDAMGKVHLIQGDLDRALTCHQEALNKLLRANADTLTTQINIAAVHMARRDYNSALMVYHQVLAKQKSALKATKAGSSHEAAKAVYATLQSMARCFDQMNQGPGALRYRQEASSVLEEAGLSQTDAETVSSG